MSKHAADWIRPEIQGLSAYHVPDPGEMIKLDAMENPFGWPEVMVEEWLELMAQAPLNRYPDPQAGPLKQRLRHSMAIPETAELMLGNGSDELIQIMALALAGPERVVLAPEPSFVMYRMIGLFAGLRYVGVPLRADDFSLDMPAMLAAIEEHQPALVFLSYPNNPTGNLFSRAEVETIIEAAPGLVVVDEAYAPFAEASFIGDLGRYEHLVVMRTVSKIGLAGLRLGLLAGPSSWLHEFEKLRLPYNINVLTQLSVDFALQHEQVFAEQTAHLRQERAALEQALAARSGVEVYPSRANFILLRVPAGRATALFEGLKQRGVLIKNLHNAGGLLRDCLRVTVGAPQENAAFLSAFDAAWADLA